MSYTYGATESFPTIWQLYYTKKEHFLSLLVSLNLEKKKRKENSDNKNSVTELNSHLQPKFPHNIQIKQNVGVLREYIFRLWCSLAGMYIFTHIEYDDKIDERRVKKEPILYGRIWVVI